MMRCEPGDAMARKTAKNLGALGVGPYSVVGYVERFSEQPGDVRNILPTGKCACCGKAIRYCVVIADASGTTHEVGKQCALKRDPGLYAAVLMHRGAITKSGPEKYDTTTFFALLRASTHAYAPVWSQRSPVFQFAGKLACGTEWRAEMHAPGLDHSEAQALWYLTAHHLYGVEPGFTAWAAAVRCGDLGQAIRITRVAMETRATADAARKARKAAGSVC